MKNLLNNKNLVKFNILLIPLAVLFTSNNLLYKYLEKETKEGFIKEDYSFFELFRLSENFSLNEKSTGKSKEITEETIVFNNYKLEGVYISNEKSFIYINDGKISKQVFLNKFYKPNLKLIKINKNNAIFLAFGKKYVLNIGIEGQLPHKEFVTKTIYEETSTKEEWKTIPYSVVTNGINNIEKLSQEADIRILKENDKIIGFRVIDIEQSSILYKLGVINGDVITSINNQNLNSYGEILNLYKKLPNMNSIKINVLRNNSEKEIIYEIIR